METTKYISLFLNYFQMKKQICVILLIFLSNLSFSQIITEEQISNLAREMSESLANTKVMNSEILINRIYSLKRDLVFVYDVPEDMTLSEQSVKTERLKQLKAFGGDFFYNNKVNIEMWFMKNKKMYKRVRINYNEIKK